MGDRSQETGEIRLEAGIWKLESGMGGRTTSFQLLASNFFYPATIAHFFEKWFDRLAALAGFVALDGLVAFDALVALGWGSVLECLVVPEMESGDRRQETGDRRQESEFLKHGVGRAHGGSAWLGRPAHGPEGLQRQGMKGAMGCYHATPDPLTAPRLEAGIWKLESGMGGRTTSFQLLASNFFHPATIAHFFEKWFDRLAALAGLASISVLVPST